MTDDANLDNRQYYRELFLRNWEEETRVMKMKVRRLEKTGDHEKAESLDRLADAVIRFGRSMSGVIDDEPDDDLSEEWKNGTYPTGDPTL